MSFNSNSSPACIFATLAAGSAVKIIAGYLLSKQRDDPYELVGRVSALYCYPIKSFRGLTVEKGECTALGLSCYGVTDRYRLASVYKFDVLFDLV